MFDESNTCNKCNGNGQLQCNKCNGVGKITCFKCLGSGRLEYNSQGLIGYHAPSLNLVIHGQRVIKNSVCYKCGGAGELECLRCMRTGGVTCKKCSGTGQYFPPTYQRLSYKPAEERVTGKVKWYNPDKGFGFIVPDNGGKDVHVSSKNLQGTASLQSDSNVSFVIREGSKGPWAALVRIF